MQPRQLIIHGVGELRATPKGHRYLECDSHLGRVAVWGTAANMRNIRLMRQQALPCEVVIMGIPSGAQAHQWWVPEDSTLYFPAS